MTYKVSLSCLAMTTPSDFDDRGPEPCAVPLAGPPPRRMGRPRAGRCGGAAPTEILPQRSRRWPRRTSSPIALDLDAASTFHTLPVADTGQPAKADDDMARWRDHKWPYKTVEEQQRLAHSIDRAGRAEA